MERKITRKNGDLYLVVDGELHSISELLLPLVKKQPAKKPAPPAKPTIEVIEEVK